MSGDITPSPLHAFMACRETTFAVTINNSSRSGYYLRYHRH